MKKTIMFVMLFAMLLFTTVYAETIEIGDVVELGLYEDQSILWRVININEEGHLLLWSENSLMEKSFDGGTNTWIKSSIRTWLNSQDSQVLYPYNIPDKEHILVMTTEHAVSEAELAAAAYDTDPGFLTGFSEDELKMIQKHNYKVVLNEKDALEADGGIEYYDYQELQVMPGEAIRNYDDAYYKMVEDLIFLLSIQELNDYVLNNALSLEKVNRVNETVLNNRLRTTGLYNNTALTFGFKGLVSDNGGLLDNNYTTSILPAMYVDVSEVTFDGIGTVEQPFRKAENISQEIIEVEGASAWAVEAIIYIDKRNLITDRLINQYKSNITREAFAELSVLLYEYLEQEKTEVNIENPFIDTENPEIVKAYQIGIVAGVSVDEFEPDSYITREQMCTMFYKAVMLAVPSISDYRRTLTYEDADLIADYALKSVEFFSHYEVMSGIGENQFSPKGHASVEEAIVVMDNILRQIREMTARVDYHNQMYYKPGDAGRFVEEIQEKLNKSFVNLDKESVVFNKGYYDAVLLENIKVFQETKNLSNTGNVDFETFQNIHNTSFSGDLTESQKNYKNYFSDEKILEQYSEEALNQVKLVLDQVYYKEEMTDYEKIKSAYDYVTQNVEYNFPYYKGESLDCVFNPIDVLNENYTVCSGYASTMNFLLAFGDIPSYYISGTVFTTKENHGWNLVKMDGLYYYLDATWDAGNERYQYFLLSEQDMELTAVRVWAKRLYPYSEITFTTE